MQCASKTLSGQQQHRPFSSPSLQQGRRQAAAPLRAFKLKPSSGGAELNIDKAVYLVGADAGADLKLKGSQVAAKHAELQQKGKQVFLKALQGESVFDRTYTWIDEQEARPNVSYVLASGSTVAFGEQQQTYVVEFEEPSGSNPLMEMMMQGMASNPEVKKALE